MKDKKSISSYLGYSFAYLQSAFDTILDLGFRKIDAIASSKNTSWDKKMWIPKKIAFVTLWFIWNVGKSYYKKYRELNTEKNIWETKK